MNEAKELARMAEVDRDIVATAKDLKVLSMLSWPTGVQKQFLDAWHRGQPSLPEVRYSPVSLRPTRERLDNARQELVRMDHPLAVFLAATAESYVILCDLLGAIGTPDMLPHSLALYGSPTDSLSGGDVHNLDAARHFLDVSQEYYRQSTFQETDYCLPAETLQRELAERLETVFEPGLVKIEIDPNLVSKAAAGATSIRLRGGTCFTEYDAEQLLQHEAFVHSLTALNGRKQSRFRALGLPAPRTTGSQEGLATFAELVTGAIDINRMERIALRVIAIDHALSGADFIDVFRFFLEQGQVEMESFNSTMRVFRGAPLTGGCAFTKDVVYLHGLMEVHTFFRWAMQHQRLELCRYFFAGRMTISDVIRLAPLFQSGVLDQPTYLPPWMVRTNGLAGYLAFSVFANRITVTELNEHHRFDRVTDIGM